MKIKPRTPKNYSEYVKIIEEIQKKSNSNLWYRGVSNVKYKLLPSFYRQKKKLKPKEYETKESQLMDWFKLRSIPFHTRNLSDEWDQLFFMQHYGIPTRLLDWTENPFMGLFFAISKPTTSSRKIKTDACVWVLNAPKWNQHTLKSTGFGAEIMSTKNPETSGYKPGSSISREKPVAIYGAHNSARIVAQRGVFVIFGNTVKPMEDIFVNDTYPDNCISKIIIKKELIPKFNKSLFCYGLSESVIYPDLEGLALEAKRIFGYGD